MYYDERKEVVAEAQTPTPDLDQRLLQATEPWRRHLLAAAECLRTDGWCQGISQRQGRRCLQAALGYVVALTYASHPSVQLAFNVANNKVAKYVGCHPDKTYVWNDVPGRTVEQVIAALEGAARA